MAISEAVVGNLRVNLGVKKKWHHLNRQIGGIYMFIWSSFRSFDSTFPFRPLKNDGWKMIHFLLGWYIWYVDFRGCIHHIVGVDEAFSFLLGYILFLADFSGALKCLGPVSGRVHLMGNLPGLGPCFPTTTFLEAWVYVTDSRISCFGGQKIRIKTPEKNLQLASLAPAKMGGAGGWKNDKTWCQDPNLLLVAVRVLYWKF